MSLDLCISGKIWKGTFCILTNLRWFSGWLMWKYICFIFPDPLDLCSLFWSFKQSNLVFFCVIDYEWNSTLATSQQKHQNMAYPKLNKNLCAVMTQFHVGTPQMVCPQNWIGIEPLFETLRWHFVLKKNRSLMTNLVDH